MMWIRGKQRRLDWIVKISRDPLREERIHDRLLDNLSRLRGTSGSAAEEEKERVKNFVILLRMEHSRVPLSLPLYPRPEILLTKDCHTVNGSQICIRKVRARRSAAYSFVYPIRNYEAR